MARRMSEDDRNSETEEPAGKLAQRGDEDNHFRMEQVGLRRERGHPARLSLRSRLQSFTCHSSLSFSVLLVRASALKAGRMPALPARMVFLTRATRGCFNNCQTW